MTFLVRDFRRDDYPQVQRIYQAGIDSRLATFETTVKSWQQWDVAMLSSCRLVAADGDTVLGWAALSPVSSRACYRGVAEVSVYVAPDASGCGVGTALLTALTAASEQAGLWTLQAGIFAHNHASIAVHEKCDFRLVGLRPRLAKLNDKWIDIAFMERRSDIIN